jgi:uncharacterized protein
MARCQRVYFLAFFYSIRIKMQIFNMDLPHFKYHPNAYKLDLFKKSKKSCQCCGQARGYIYDKSVYSTDDIDALCPWCIADGSAAKKFDAEFIQGIEPQNEISKDDFTQPDTLDSAIVDELTQRTPGYVSWQGEYWLTHCNDGCEYHGDVQQNELLTLPEATISLFKQEHDYLFTPKNWGSIEAFNEIYFPAGDIALYKFVCRHCGFIRLHCDMS